MWHNLPIQSVIFDMDGLIIDSEPFWTQGEREVFSQIGLDLTIADKLPDMLGLRIDYVVDLWYYACPWERYSKKKVAQMIIDRVIGLVEEKRPILPGVYYALELCCSLNLKIALASASPKYMLEKILTLFEIRDYFSAVFSAAELLYSKPHPDIYLNVANFLETKPIHCVALEDSFNGMIATKAARMRSIVIPCIQYFNDPRWCLADAKLSSLNKLSEKYLR